eukprot:TRINITY_DN4595_c0_g1_i1.p1 TRINITY_DN4595_c0_g1~~TRINITY_DN4595_c0_g1_i1.p1  ORF type:complete len:868 (+),score=109.50 TRINITY_DN4595_c0_g1_i1:89-2692(+)
MVKWETMWEGLACDEGIAGNGHCTIGTCGSNYYGADCDRFCVESITCASMQPNVRCDQDGGCKCAARWAGSTCNSCAAGWYGSGCLQRCCADDVGGCNRSAQAPAASSACVCYQDQINGYWAAPDCQSCSLGWAGSKCTSTDTTYRSPPLIVVLATFSLQKFTGAFPTYVPGISADYITVISTSTRAGNGTAATEVIFVVERVTPIATATALCTTALDSNSDMRLYLGVIGSVVVGVACPTTAFPDQCSGEGACNFTTGVCTCNDGFSGSSCTASEQSAGLGNVGRYVALGVIGGAFLLAWSAGWLVHRQLWKDYKFPEIVQYLTPYHKVPLAPYALHHLAIMFYALFLITFAFANSVPWPTNNAPGTRALRQLVLRDLSPRTQLVSVYVGFGLAIVISILAWFVCSRLEFLVRTSPRVWHATLASPATRGAAMNADPWRKPRWRPPGYLPPLVVLPVLWGFFTLAPFVYSCLLSAFVCTFSGNSATSFLHSSWACFGGQHIGHMVLSAIGCLIYYGSFLRSSFLYVAGMEKLQNRTLELALPSFVQTRRFCFFLFHQLAFFIAVLDAFVASYVPYILIVYVWALLGTLVLSLRLRPFNIPNTNWTTGCAISLATWVQVAGCVTFFINDKKNTATVLVLGLGIAVLVVFCGLLLCAFWCKSREMQRQQRLPAALMQRQAEMQRREQLEIDRFARSLKMEESDLEIDLDALDTPRSVVPGVIATGPVVVAPPRNPASSGQPDRWPLKKKKRTLLELAQQDSTTQSSGGAVAFTSIDGAPPGNEENTNTNNSAEPLQGDCRPESPQAALVEPLMAGELQRQSSGLFQPAAIELQSPAPADDNAPLRGLENGESELDLLGASGVAIVVRS